MEQWIAIDNVMNLHILAKNGYTATFSYICMHVAGYLCRLYACDIAIYRLLF